MRAPWAALLAAAAAPPAAGAGACVGCQAGGVCCDPNAKPAQVCPGGKPCCDCGLGACLCGDAPAPPPTPAPPPPPHPSPPRAPVDPATPADAQSVTDSKGNTLKLVFSDEFEDADRGFQDGADEYWTAVDHFNPTSGDLEYYTPSAVTTRNGSMVITLSDRITAGHPYTSGMVQSWNKMCFTGGVVDVKVKLPGDGTKPGYWPAVWLMGNLGRAGWQKSTGALWPWSYDTCDNSASKWQLLDACNASPGHGLNANQGRGSPEIDILEVNICPFPGRCPNDTQSGGPYKEGARLFSTMHFTPKNPAKITDGKPGYAAGVEVGEATALTPEGGHKNLDGDGLHDFLGATYPLAPAAYQSAHVYRLEWVPTQEKATQPSGGYLRWELDGKHLATVTDTALRPTNGTGTDGGNYSVGQRLISNEPSYMIFNLAISDFWHSHGGDLPMPATLEIEHVRIYQKEGSEQTSCSPESHPTAKYIQDNIDKYTGK
eukprot:TRINITY_DN20781_c0_g1_i1.p1 TRINITY_DN20781_c0_g1~~TRINITY_DN20781_c0_g1_i1.p1  ORF type:complete len:514 (+),score=161.60 TRINITY_DN20781_c0_g1_i1:83-1543(+)